jgi:methionyl-tRNA synthetase
MTPEKYYYITTPIYYVNDVPHIGHAYTTLACDVMARFKRLDGFTVKFLTGTDEHGQKIEKTAKAMGKDPQPFVDEVSQNFRQLAQLMNFSNDDFIRTTESRHKEAVEQMWQTLIDRGEIYLGSYSGWYAVRDEAFYAESELIDGKAPTGAEVEWITEPSYFFRLSQWQDKLLEFYHQNPDFIGPISRRNEVLRFVEGGLTDLSISRTSFSWGIPVPGDEKHVIYVWLDALTNYLTAIGYPKVSQEFDGFWHQSLHVLGKDISRFHAVYWPAFLMAAGLTPPKRLFIHGWWTNSGEKISKSLGNVIDPVQLVETYGLDAVRYFLMREIPFGNDGDFSHPALIGRLNSDLANSYGNLVQRVLSFVAKQCGGKVPQPGTFTQADQDLLNHAAELIAKLRDDINHQALHKYCEHIWRVISEANKYVDEQKPWSLKGSDPERMATILYVLAETIRQIALVTQPLMPNASAKILDQLAVDPQKRQFSELTTALDPGQPLPPPEGVFPRWVEGG